MASDVKGTGMENAYRSEHQKSSDRTGLTDGAGGPNAKRDFGDKASDMADDVAHKARQAGGKLQNKASNVGDSMQEAGHEFAEKSKHTHEAIVGFTKENPTAAVLLAFGLGAILARILPGR